MDTNFATCLQNVLCDEGGYTNNAADPGGPTKYGITIFDVREYLKPDATASDVKALTLDDVSPIYRVRYWAALSCDRLPNGLDYAIFDYGVHSGVGRAGKVLRRVLGMSDLAWQVTADVLVAINDRDVPFLIRAVCRERLLFLRHLTTWPTFGRGWGKRVASVERIAVKMTRPSHSPTAPR